MHKISNIFSVFILFLLVLHSFSFADLDETGINPLDLRFGARPNSMGDAYTAIPDDANSILYNPASISISNGIFLSAQDASNFSICQAAASPGGTVGIGIVYHDYQKITYGSGTANYNGNIIFLGYGFGIGGLSFNQPYLRFLKDCHLGLTYKNLMNQTISFQGSPTLSSSNVSGFDTGFLFAPEDSWLSLGVNFMGGMSYTLDPTTETVMGSTNVGVAVKIIGDKGKGIFTSKDIELLFSSDVVPGDKVDNKVFSAMGLEFGLFKNYYLRCGTKQAPENGDDKNYPSYGIGMKFASDWSVDLSSKKDHITESDISCISVSYMPSAFGWRPSKEEKREKEEIIKDFIKVSYPPDNFVSYDDKIKVQGSVKKGTAVLINDAPAYVDDNLNYSVEIPLSPRKNLIVVKGKLKDREESVELKVLRKAKVTIAEEETIDKQIKTEITDKEEKLMLTEKSIEEQKQKAKEATEKKRLEEETKKLEEEKAKLQEKKQELTVKKEQLEQRKEKVENLVTLGVIDVSPEKKFEIEAKITRGEMISWLVKAANLPVPEVTSNVCADVPKDHQFAPYIKAAIEAGLVKPDKENKFYPDKAVSESDGEELFKEFGVIK